MVNSKTIAEMTIGVKENQGYGFIFLIEVATIEKCYE